MDLSKTAKKKRDVVEDPLWRVSRLADRLNVVKDRAEATAKVWPETKRTLQPAVKEVDRVLQELNELKRELAALWKAGAETKWNSF